MRSAFLSLAILIILATLVLPIPVAAESPHIIQPTISIVKVVPDNSITVRARNFPVYQNFDILMAPMGYHGANGIFVKTIYTGYSRGFTLTLTIPPALYGQYQIALRFQKSINPTDYIYNWFYNNYMPTPSGTPPDQYIKLIPTFAIINVNPDVSVSIQTANFPPGKIFDVYMGHMGTRGIGGVPTAAVASGPGGVLVYAFNIPPSLAGVPQIAIRMQSQDNSGYFAYNWFNNNLAWNPGGAVPAPIPGYAGYP